MALELKLNATSAVLCTPLEDDVTNITGCTLIGFCYLESHLNPKLAAAN